MAFLPVENSKQGGGVSAPEAAKFAPMLPKAVTLNCRGHLLDLSRPVVMGIINLTPDSFYADSRRQTTLQVLARAEQMLNEGASILDLGAQSTRPGAAAITVEEELSRLLEPLHALCSRFPEVPVSVDTFYSRVAIASVEAGAGLINDISAGSRDPEMFPTIARLGVPYILMHAKGTPATMQAEPAYRSVTEEVFDFLKEKMEQLQELGAADLLVDPGFGFGKTAEHNFSLLHHLADFQLLGRPVVAGVSRKSMIHKTLHIKPEEALNGTTVLHTLALLNQANILRAHDVKQAVETIQLIQSYNHAAL